MPHGPGKFAGCVAPELGLTTLTQKPFKHKIEGQGVGLLAMVGEAFPSSGKVASGFSKSSSAWCHETWLRRG